MSSYQFHAPSRAWLNKDIDKLVDLVENRGIDDAECLSQCLQRTKKDVVTMYNALKKQRKLGGVANQQTTRGGGAGGAASASWRATATGGVHAPVIEISSDDDDSDGEGERVGAGHNPDAIEISSSSYSDDDTSDSEEDDSAGGGTPAGGNNPFAWPPSFGESPFGAFGNPSEPFGPRCCSKGPNLYCWEL